MIVNIPSITSGLEREDDGIWYCSTDVDVSFPNDGHSTLVHIEDHSFWFQHRNACINKLVSQFPPPEEGTIFDVGGGNGVVAKSLIDSGFDVILIEPCRDGVQNARKRGIEKIICGTTEGAKIITQSLPAVGVFDVVEHIEDDLSFLKHIHDLLQNDGMLYLTVPAYRILWSMADVLAGHYRRYTLKSIQQRVEEAGFSVEYGTYFFRPLPLVSFPMRAIPYRLGFRSEKSRKRSRNHDRRAAKQGVASKIFSRLLTSEVSKVNRGKVMRFGGSCLMAARKISEEEMWGENE